MLRWEGERSKSEDERGEGISVMIWEGEEG